MFRGAHYNIGMSMNYNRPTMLKKCNVKYTFYVEMYHISLLSSYNSVNWLQ